ncbi:hypothetical protein D3C75_1035360 [compost metagenome]
MLQVFRAERCAVLLKILRRTANYMPVHSKGAGDKCAVRKVAEPDRNVRAGLDKVQYAVSEKKANADMGIFADEAIDQLADPLPTQIGRARQADSTQ